MDRNSILLLAAAIAVAMGTAKATAEANLAAAYPQAPEPEKKPEGVIGHAREVKGGEFVDYEVLDNGSRREIARGQVE